MGNEISGCKFWNISSTRKPEQELRPYEQESPEILEAPSHKTAAGTAFLAPDGVKSVTSNTELHPCVLNEADHLATTEEDEDGPQETLIKVIFEYNISPEVDVIRPEVNNLDPEQEPDMAELQLNSPDFQDIFLNLKDRVLPDNEKHAKFILCSKSVISYLPA